MDLNFNNYICSVIALSLINPSNFWGAVQTATWGQGKKAPPASPSRALLARVSLLRYDARISHSAHRIPEEHDFPFPRNLPRE